MLSLLVSTSMCCSCRLFVRSFASSSFVRGVRPFCRSLSCWPCSVDRSFYRSFFSLVIGTLAHSFSRLFIYSSSHLSIHLLVSGDTFSSVANAVLEDLTMNALLTARVIGHRSGLPCLELYLVQGQQVSERDYFIFLADSFGIMLFEDEGPEYKFLKVGSGSSTIT